MTTAQEDLVFLQLQFGLQVDLGCLFLLVDLLDVMVFLLFFLLVFIISVEIVDKVGSELLGPLAQFYVVDVFHTPFATAFGKMPFVCLVVTLIECVLVPMTVGSMHVCTAA